MTTVQVLFWRDIPSQVRARAGRERVSVALSARFQEAIDAAAMAAGLFGSDDYTNAFFWSDPVEHPGTPAEAAAEVAARIEAETQSIDWRATAKSVKSESRESE